MRIAIVDDNMEEADYLRSICGTWGKERNLYLEIQSFDSGEAILEVFKARSFDIIFLDIYMKNLNGIQTAQQIRSGDISCLLIFMTVSKEHVWESFSVHPFQYLVKPCETKQIRGVLDEAEKVLPKADRFLDLSIGRKKITLFYADISYTIADGHHTLVTTREGEQLRTYTPISRLSGILLSDSRFLLCNRGILLNMDEVKALHNDVFVMNNGKVLPMRLKDRRNLRLHFFTHQMKRAKEAAF